MKNISTCTAAAAIMLAIHPGLARAAASHCKGLEEQVCGSTVACKWAQERKSTKWFDKAGNPQTTKAHCRLDMAKAATIAAEIAKGRAKAGN